MTWTKKKNKTWVIHIKAGIRNSIRIDRRTKWGNPFPIVKGVRTRTQAIEEFRVWIHEPAQAELKAQVKTELKGKLLACWCKPLDCHGDVLVEIADHEEENKT